MTICIEKHIFSGISDNFSLFQTFFPHKLAHTPDIRKWLPQDWRPIQFFHRFFNTLKEKLPVVVASLYSLLQPYSAACFLET